MSTTMAIDDGKSGAAAAPIRNTRPMPADQTQMSRRVRRRSTRRVAGICSSCTKNGTAASMPMDALSAPSATAKPARNTPVVSVPMASLAMAS
jgi:hypothetical protein